MDVARAYVDAVHGEPQGSVSLPLELALVAFFRGEEVRAYELAVGLEGPYVERAAGRFHRPFLGGRLGVDGSVSASYGQQCPYECEE
ncbi:hypothetical protein [Streptomyces dysideae]|uniref:Uncharacterized protein n=1 Tax=Streptomyces dysideae TaxID=909626 RepID=A0A101V192_9ACTN|nr:hypothetical protein [Streptomyces dysideae]KUO20583.1 hypothetical protein AQJ91_13545 [Streptomyces dysideae]